MHRMQPYVVQASTNMLHHYVDGLFDILLYHGHPVAGVGIQLEPLKILLKLWGETDGSFILAIPKSGQHAVEEQPGR